MSNRKVYKMTTSRALQIVKRACERVSRNVDMRWQAEEVMDAYELIKKKLNQAPADERSVATDGQ